MNITWTTKPFSDLTRGELHDVLKLRVDVFVVEQQCPYAEIDGADPTAFHLMGRTAQGDLVAYARILSPEGEGPPHIGRVVVHPDFRGKGLGRAVMEAALNALEHSHGSKRSFVSAQSHLEGLYASLGYVRQGPDYDWDGIIHVDMLREA
jgi:ElaA protein